MSLENLQGFSGRFLRCTAGHDHATEPVWASDQQSGMYSRRKLPTFHCGSCGAMTAVTARSENWRKYRIAEVVEEGRFFACRRCFPELASFLMQFWAKLLKPRST
jgi:hypothetical protein